MSLDKQQWRGGWWRKAKRQCWKDGDGDKQVAQCVHWNDYGSNNMVLWKTLNDLRFNFKLVNKMLCIDFLTTSCMMSPYENPLW